MGYFDAPTETRSTSSKSWRNERKRREEVAKDYSCTYEHEKQTGEII